MSLEANKLTPDGSSTEVNPQDHLRGMGLPNLEELRAWYEKDGNVELLAQVDEEISRRERMQYLYSISAEELQKLQQTYTEINDKAMLAEVNEVLRYHLK